MFKRNSQRQLKVSENLKRLLSEILMSFSFKTTSNNYFNFIISEVDISPDLKVASIFVSPYWIKDSESNVDEEILNILNENLSSIKKKMGANLGMRHTPKILFKIDDLIKKTEKIENLFKDPHIAQDL